MKKSLFLITLVLLSVIVLGQEQEQLPVQPNEQPQEQPQVQPAEPPPAPLALPEGRDLKTVRFPHAFIHAGMEYPAGKYWMVLGEKDGQAVFFVANAAKELLFEDLAIVRAHPVAGTQSRFHVNIERTMGNEYMRVKVTTQEQWLLGYFLVKK